MDARGAGGPGLRRAQSRRAGLDHPPLRDPSEGIGRRDRKDHLRHPGRAGPRGHRGGGLWAGQAPLFDLAQDGGKGAKLLAPLGHLRLPDHHRIGSRLLPGAGGDPSALEAGAGPVQGLHLQPQIERLPLAAHHRLGARRQAGRDADPHPRDARGGRNRRRGALVLPRWREGGEPLRRRSRALDRVADRAARRGSRSRRVPRSGQARDVHRSGLLLLAQGRCDQIAARGDAHRFRLCDPHPHRPRLRRRQGRRDARALVDPAEERPIGRDHHRRGPVAAGHLDRHRQDRPRQDGDPPRAPRGRPRTLRAAGPRAGACGLRDGRAARHRQGAQDGGQGTGARRCGRPSGPDRQRRDLRPTGGARDLPRSGDDDRRRGGPGPRRRGPRAASGAPARRLLPARAGRADRRHHLSRQGRRDPRHRLRRARRLRGTARPLGRSALAGRPAQRDQHRHARPDHRQ